MKNRLTIILLFLFFFAFGFSQNSSFKSIHQEESEHYSNLGLKTAAQFDSLNGFKGISPGETNKQFTLSKRVFGYHPYWGGSNYLNYHWDLLSDLCYFSFEVDPATGEAITTHEWSTSPAIDSALVHGVNVHLCVTLFSGHSQFFGNPVSQQTLITNIINLVISRGANGVNMDVEALPSSLGSAFTAFINDLSSQFHIALPGGEVSIAAPAVNWSGTFDIPVLNEAVDFFIVMGYDYYWNGSSQAGPVSPLYTMTGNYDYNFSKTISYYQSQDVPSTKLLIGVPYYARQWPTTGQFAPSSTTGSGTAFTLSNIYTNSSGYYTPENKLFEPNSFSPYYSFDVNGWHQCFTEDTYSLGKKYDVVNSRNLAGIGIWALGYDDGYTDLWDLIANRFTTEAIPKLSDTIYDTGGPAFNYYNNEDYTYTISVPADTNITLSFAILQTEPDYDSLWIYDGPDPASSLKGAYSGDTLPGLIVSSGNSLTLRFHSDIGITNSGWMAFYNLPPGTAIYKTPYKVGNGALIYPNPCSNDFQLEFNLKEESDVRIVTLNSAGQLIKEIFNQRLQPGIFKKSFMVTRILDKSKGTFFLSIYLDDKLFSSPKLIIY